MRTQKSIITEEKILLNGEKRVFLVCKYPWIEASEILGVIGIGIDITGKPFNDKDKQYLLPKALSYMNFSSKK